MKRGLKNIEAWQESCFWKEPGCRNDFSTLADRMKARVKPVTRRKVQKSMGSTIAQNGIEIRRKIPQAFSKWEQKARTSKREWKWQRGIVAQQGPLQLDKVGSQISPKVWARQLEGFMEPCCHGRLIAGKSEESGELVGRQWYSWTVMKRWSPCLGCTAQWRQNMRSSAPSRVRS